MYKLKGNGTAVITGFDWGVNGSNDVYVPRMIDGYTVSEIGDSAFSSEKGNGYSVVVVLPDTITVIGEKAFWGSAITAISIPQSVQLIGSGAFAGCTNLESHNVEAGNPIYTTINGILFDKTKKELVSFPAGRTAILENLPSSSTAIPDGIVSIGEYAFAGCTIEIDGYICPDSLKRIENYAFCKAWFKGHDEFLNLNNVEFIGDYAFTEATFGYLVEVCGGAKEIGAFAFANTVLYRQYGGFTSGNVEKIGPYAFAGVGFFSGKDTIKLPSTLKELGEGAFAQVYKDDRGRLKNLDFSETNITTIPKYAFSESDVTVLLPEKVLTIDPYAFHDYHGGMVGIPNSVTSIGAYAFAESRGAFIQDANKSNLKNIDEYAFYNVSYLSEADDDNLILPKKLESIGSHAYWTNNTVIMDIPATVKTIGDDFCDRSKTTLKVVPGSFAAIYASENGYRVQGDEDTSWLND